MSHGTKHSHDGIPGQWVSYDDEALGQALWWGENTGHLISQRYQPERHWPDRAGMRTTMIHTMEEHWISNWTFV